MDCCNSDIIINNQFQVNHLNEIIQKFYRENQNSLITNYTVHSYKKIRKSNEEWVRYTMNLQLLFSLYF